MINFPFVQEANHVRQKIKKMVSTTTDPELRVACGHFCSSPGYQVPCLNLMRSVSDSVFLANAVRAHSLIFKQILDMQRQACCTCAQNFIFISRSEKAFIGMPFLELSFLWCLIIIQGSPHLPRYSDKIQASCKYHHSLDVCGLH